VFVEFGQVIRTQVDKSKHFLYDNVSEEESKKPNSIVLLVS